MQEKGTVLITNYRFKSKFRRYQKRIDKLKKQQKILNDEIELTIEKIKEYLK